MNRLIARFVVETPQAFHLKTRYDKGWELESLDKAAPEAKSLLHKHPAANWFERKAYDDFGVVFRGSYDTRPLIAHEHIQPHQFPMHHSFQSAELATQEPIPYPYEIVGGDTTYEIAVGPIHAGIIEPGHFHFSQAGEAILHQEVRHFYKYRAIEKMLEGKSLDQAWSIISRISGHSSLAWQWAFAEAIAASGELRVPQAWRFSAALLLELERVAHHLTDLGFIPNDAGFAAALAWATSLAEQTRRQMKLLTGHRFGFEALWRGQPLKMAGLQVFVSRLKDELARFSQWIEGIPSVWDRLDTTGRLSLTDAKAYDVVGLMARASGVAVDCRAQDSLYQALGFEVIPQSKGDVAARFRQRLAEVAQSLDLIEALLPEVSSNWAFEWPMPTGEGEAVVESVLGELFVWLSVKEGRIERFYARDPSFINWQALHLMMPGNIIADFPLINKSCDLSYAGSDL